MAADPIAAILAAQQPAGYWEKPGPGYATKCRGTVWAAIEPPGSIAQRGEGVRPSQLL
jgi:hypothetical protein